MNKYCPNNVNTCSDPDDPRGNFSSAEPDKEIFIARAYSVQQEPPLGTVWYASSCVGRVRSTVSQEDANLRAQQANKRCEADQWPELEPNPSNDPNQPPYIPVTRRTYLNEQQIAEYTCEDGSVFTYTVPAGMFTEFSQEAANAQAASYAKNQSIDQRICLSDLEVTSVCLGSDYEQTITFSNAVAPLIVTLTAGTLPAGLTFDYTDFGTITISGVASGTGGYTFTFQVLDANGNYCEKEFTIVVASIATAVLPDGQDSVPYSQTIAYDGTISGSAEWTIVSGSLPTGLSLNSTSGVISGTPTTPGEYTFEVQMEDGK